MKHLSLILLLILAASCAMKPREYHSFESTPSPHLYADRFGNIFILNKAGEIDMYNTNGEFLFNYANNAIGDITHLDVTNPQNIVAYVKDFNTIVLLDNTLAELKTINLANLEYPDITAVAASNDGNYWIYDQVNWRLVKISRLGTEINQSNRLTDYNLTSFVPLHILERDNRVYISTSTEKLLIFDNFGQYIKAIPMEGIGKFCYLDGTIYYLHGKTILSYDLQYLIQTSEPTIQVEGGAIVDMQKTNKGFVYLTTDGKFTYAEQ